LLTCSPALVHGGAACACELDVVGAGALDDGASVAVAVGEPVPDDAQAAASTAVAERSRPPSTGRAGESDRVMVFP
jgi:hypothetical protein